MTDNSRTITNYVTKRESETNMSTNNHSLMFGHRKLNFATPVDSGLVCTLCGKIMQQPIQTLRGLVACAQCYEHGREMIGNLCPLDAEEISSQDLDNFTRPDKFISRDISKLKVYCVYEDKGCKWIGHLNDIDDHEYTGCDYAFTQCDKCDENVLKKKWKEHQIECSDLKNCGKSLELDDLKEHNEICSKQYSNSEMNDDNLLAQLERLVEENNILKEECDKNNQSLDRTKKDLEDSKKVITGLKSDMQQLNNFINEQNDTICKLKKKLNDTLKMTEDLHPVDFYSNKIKELENMQSSLIGKLSPMETTEKIQKVYDNTGLIKQLENDQAISNANLADIELKIQLLEKLSTTGHQIWKIENFAYRLSQAQNKKGYALHSAPCYTDSINGYKFCVRVYPNGDGTGLNTHVSIYFVLMKNHYDNLLEWPFYRKVTFRLINVRDISKSKKETFITDKSSSSFQKPIKDMNIAAGCPRFLSKENLLNGGFIVDDSIYVETIVQEL